MSSPFQKNSGFAKSSRSCWVFVYPRHFALLVKHFWRGVLSCIIFSYILYIYICEPQSSEPFESTTAWRGGHLIRWFFLRKLRMRVISCQGGNRVPSSLEWCLGFWCPFVLKLTSQVSMISPSSKSCINPLIWQSICIGASKTIKSPWDGKCFVNLHVIGIGLSRYIRNG